MTGGTLVIVASGLRDSGGHNYTYTRAVEDELRSRGFDVQVLANAGLSTIVRSHPGYRAVFSRGTYDFPRGKGPLLSLVRLWSQARTYAGELEAAIADTETRPVRAVFCHTLSDYELVGWRHFTRRWQSTTPLILMMRETAGFAEMGLYRRWLHPYTGLRARAFASIDRARPGGFVLATDTELLSADYGKIFRGSIRTFPIPVRSLLPPEPPDHRLPMLRFGYVGDCRAAKGFPRLAPMIEEVIACGGDARVGFVVQLYRGSYEQDANPAGWRQLEALSAKYPSRLQLVRGVLSDDSYRELFSSLDAVLIPNDHPAFRAGSSNVFCEATASGKPVVVAAGTWMSNQLERYGGGRTFSLDEPSSFSRSVLGLVENWQEASDKARRFCPVWRSEHNPATLVDALLRASSDAGASMADSERSCP